MKKIKVLHVTFDMTIGGAQQVIRQLVENMDEKKIHSEIVCIDNKLGEIGEILQQQGFSVHLLNRQEGFDFNLIKQLYKLIKHNHYDVIHCHQYSPYVYGLLASILTSAKVIFTEHGRFYPDYGTWKRKLINPIFSLFTAKITAISKATKAALIEHENFSAKHIDVIYNGIKDQSEIEVDEIALKSKFNIPQEAFIFGTISRLQPIKNQSMMIKAFKEVNDNHKNTHLLIVGDGEIKKELESLVSELKINNCVTFAGFQKNPYIFHKIIDVFLLTSYSEGTSMTLLEAISFSTPCLATDVGGSGEVIYDSINGYLMNSNDLEQLMKYMTKLLMDHSLKLKMELLARKSYLDRFQIHHMNEKYTLIYSKP